VTIKYDDDRDDTVNETALFAQLLESGVISETPDGDAVTLTIEFTETVETQAEAMDDEGSLDRYLQSVDLESQRQLFEQIADRAPELFPLSTAVYEHLPEVEPEELLPVSIAVYELKHGPFPSEGTPEHFLNVDYELFSSLIEMSDKCIVYIWRDDSRASELMREEFDTIFKEPPDDIVLLSLYGPDYSAALQSEYSVYGGPMTLFFSGGTVDVRLHGATNSQALRAEIAKLRDK